MNMELSQDYVLGLLQSNEKFPIDFDAAWTWIGYSKKENAKRRLLKHFVEGSDFYSDRSKNGQRGRSSFQILLTIDCFKQLAMMAGTDRGKQVREHFLNCEKLLKQLQGNSNKPVSTKIPPSVLQNYINGIESEATNRQVRTLKLIEAADSFLTKFPQHGDLLQQLLRI